MLKKSFNPLYNKVTEGTSSGSGAAAAAAPEKQPGDDKADGEGGGEEEEDPENPAAADPAPGASAAPAAPKLTAFDRTKLRAVGMGGVIQQLEAAQQTIALRDATIATQGAEITRLTTELEKSGKAVEAAAKGRENEVSAGVKDKLTTLGISEEQAPAQSAIENSPAALLDKFNTLQGAEKTAFYRANKAQLKIAEAARLAEKKA